MRNLFKNGSQVIVNGPGKTDGRYYHNKIAKILDRDPFYYDYRIQFEDGTEDWISSRHLQKLERKEIKEDEI